MTSLSLPSTIHVDLVHLSGGPTSISQAVLDLTLRNPSMHSIVLVFDFDRTLTCGFAPPSSSIERRIRGGMDTVRALEVAKGLGAELFVVTAREPRTLIVESLEAALTAGAQAELGRYFLEDPIVGQVTEEKVEGDLPLAWRGRVYASGYSKPAAIRHIALQRLKGLEEPIEIHFFDDFVGNAYDVSSMQFGGQNARVGRVVSYWFDTFSEESTNRMVPVHSSSSDFAYNERLAYMRSAFGVQEDVSKDRLNWYLSTEKPLPPPVERAAPKPLKGVGGFAGLEGLFKPKPNPIVD